jgi:hypothetical protein
VTTDFEVVGTHLSWLNTVNDILADLEVESDSVHTASDSHGTLPDPSSILRLGISNNQN